MAIVMAWSLFIFIQSVSIYDSDILFVFGESENGMER